MLSCASGPKVKEIAALHYGDDETEVVEILGEGLESLFFKLDSTNYSYRYYTTALTEHQYALLFAEGRLYAVSEEKPSFDECISLIEWEICFRSVISQMQSEHVSADDGDFSEALTEEEKIQKDNTGAVIIGVPALVVLWPVVVIMAACASPDVGFIEASKRSRQESDCLMAFVNIEERLDVHYPNSDLSHIISTINKVSNEIGVNLKREFAWHDYDITKGNRRIYGKHWACGSYANRKDLTIIYGVANNELTWVFKSVHEQTYPKHIEPERELSDEEIMKGQEPRKAGVEATREQRRMAYDECISAPVSYSREKRIDFCKEAYPIE